MFFFELVLLYILYYRGADFWNSGDFSVEKNGPAFELCTTWAEGKKSAGTTTFALVDRGDFSKLVYMLYYM